MAQKIRIIVAEDLEIFRKSLVALLQTNPELEVVADVANGRELIDHLKKVPADIVLLDTNMRLLDGEATLKIIHSRFPKVKVIVLSAHSDTKHRADFIARGANSYLYKNCDVPTLFNAIQRVKEDGYFFDSPSLALLTSHITGNQPPEIKEVSFNEREKEVLKGICEGNTNKEIASSLHLSPSTIDFYRGRIYNKTKCHNATILLKYALKNGLVVLQ